jgi:hypothetical protein
MERVQIFLQPEERTALEQLAKEAGLGISEMVQRLLRERIRQNRRVNLRKSANMMANAYKNDKELTAFRDLDGEIDAEYLDKH